MSRNWQADVEDGQGLDDGWWAAVMEDDEKHHASPLVGGASALTVTYPMAPSPCAADWEEAHRLYEADEGIELPVIGFNRGGLLVAFRSLQGFVPSSHLLRFPAQASDEERKCLLAQRTGERLRLKVIEYDPGKGRVVLSERAALAEAGSRHHILNHLTPGDVVEGQVTNICDFGAFVDLGGLEGLIHVSEVSWGRVAHPRDVLNCNQCVRVSVISIDREQSRIALSLKRLRPDPWANVAHRYQIGQIVEGVITNVVNFGAFVCVEDGLEGLIHVSELADGHFLHPRNVVREGEHVRARVMNVDGANRRLALSLRALEIESPIAD